MERAAALPFRGEIPVRERRLEDEPNVLVLSGSRQQRGGAERTQLFVRVQDDLPADVARPRRVLQGCERRLHDHQAPLHVCHPGPVEDARLRNAYLLEWVVGPENGVVVPNAEDLNRSVGSCDESSCLPERRLLALSLIRNGLEGRKIEPFRLLCKWLEHRHRQVECLREAGEIETPRVVAGEPDHRLEHLLFGRVDRSEVLLEVSHALTVTDLRSHRQIVRARRSSPPRR